MKLTTKAIVGAAALGAGYAMYKAYEHVSAEKQLEHFPVNGYVAPGFEPVREAFTENFLKRHELGGGVAAYYKGQQVVHLWGGIRDPNANTPWEEDTMAVVYSTTKGLAAMTLALAHSRGWLDHDAPVSKYWPEFAQTGKAGITVRQLLAHQAGLFAFDEPVTIDDVRDPDRLAEIMARAKPAWEPGTRQAYHAISLGFYESEILRRIDPQHRTLGRFFHDEIAKPLGLELYIRLPADIPNSRLAVIEPLSLRKRLFGFPLKFMLATLDHNSNMYRALALNPGSAIVHDEETIYARELEVPSGGGVGTADAIAHAYGEFAAGGKNIGLKKETLDRLMAPAVPATNGFYDECMFAEARFSLGFGKPSETMSMPTSTSFGHPGAGGSMGFADPENQIGYAYITNRMGTTLTGDPRDIALREALYSCAPLSAKALSAAA
ncbi:MAG: serine hydrolase domain-containing protein [Pyrinomonadaceae bacterium]|nr:serine hydrolase domain-containing protein [Pyrinomonadaceae bacterium]